MALCYIAAMDVRPLLRWYSRNARALPWRRTRNPYRIWVSEVMLQQTRVETVKPYYARWLRAFPTLQALAHARSGDVLRVWEGLGYYARARNLQRAARVVLRSHAGRVPADPALLRRLPGVGAYTAAAIASIAFDVDTAVLDGNVQRVLARLHSVRQPIELPRTQRRLQQLAAQQLPPGKAAQYNQAMMELGALVCLPRNPGCTSCPLRTQCGAQRSQLQALLPVRRAKPRVPHYDVTAGIIRRAGRVLLAQRPVGKLLGGLWEFPGGKREPGEDLPACLKRELREELGLRVRVGAQVQQLRHAFTHFKITLHAFECAAGRARPRALQAAALRWVFPAALAQYPMGKVDRQIANWLVSGLE